VTIVDTLPGEESSFQTSFHTVSDEAGNGHVLPCTGDPDHDHSPHVTDAMCGCVPRAAYRDPISGEYMIIHREWRA
jgi:hypothetical protein